MAERRDFPKAAAFFIAGLIIGAGLFWWLGMGSDSAPGPVPTDGPGPPSVVGQQPGPAPGSADPAGDPPSFPVPSGPAGERKPAAPAFQVPSGLAARLREIEQAGTEAEDRAERIQDLARDWGALDPASALAWAFTLEPGTRRAVTASLVRTWAARDPAAALEALERLQPTDPDLHEDAVRRLFNHWAGRDPALAWEAVGTIADPAARARAERDILLHWGESEPGVVAGILDRVVSSQAPLDDFAAVFETTAGQLVGDDPGAAATWALSLPEGSAKAAAVAGLTGAWLREDDQAAATWLGRMEPGPARDAGIGKLVSIRRNRDPQGSMDWALRVSDPALRSQLSMAASLSWWSVDPVAARRAVSGTPGLSEADKSAILGAFENLEQ